MLASLGIVLFMMCFAICYYRCKRYTALKRHSDVYVADNTVTNVMV